jgi:peroxiredoxin
MNSNFDDSIDTIDAKIGSIAPNFNLKATNGQEIALSDFRGKTNVVLFFIREYI